MFKKIQRMRESTPIPSFCSPGKSGEIWKVDYQNIASKAVYWAKEHDVQTAADDSFRICLIAVDVQNTFCIPGFELYVGGQSGTGAVDDNRRLSEFIYRNLSSITQICPTMDTHRAMQIFHSVYLVNDKGEHPPPFTLVSEKDILNGVWKFNPALSYSLGIDAEYGQKHLLHYTRSLKAGGKYNLTVWPYHGMLGGIGYALVASVEEAIFFHCIARYSQTDFHVKGDRPFTEHYSVIGPEVREGPLGEQIGVRSAGFLKKLLEFDAVIIAGQAKSHCVAWTIDDLLDHIRETDHRLVQKVYLLEDCTSPVVIPGVLDYTEVADSAFLRFADAGMHIVRSTDPIKSWPGF
jgi:nicotinamidase-related amidase